MKTLGLCSLLLVFIPVAVAQDLSDRGSQDQSGTTILNPNKDAIQKWARQNWRWNWRTDRNDGVIATMDDLEAGCGTMRTYRVKREARDSDTTRPSGYTTCVPMAKFRIEELSPKSEAPDAKPAE